MLIGDTEGFIKMSHARKAWPQINLAAATCDADFANMQAGAEEAEDARVHEAL